MDGSRFDGLARTLATERTRRQALNGIAGGALAALLAPFGRADAAAACVKAGKQGCDGPRDKKCCKGAICKGGSKDREGRCECKGRRQACKGKCVNTTRSNKHCGGCNRRCTGGNTCRNGRCADASGCTKGQHICFQGLDALCPGQDNCACITSVGGTAYCSDFTEGACSTCVRNSDCPEGQVCINASFMCECGDDPGSNGNACVTSTCQLNGPGGRPGPRLRTPVLLERRPLGP